MSTRISIAHVEGKRVVVDQKDLIIFNDVTKSRGDLIALNPELKNFICPQIRNIQSSGSVTSVRLNSGGLVYRFDNVLGKTQIESSGFFVVDFDFIGHEDNPDKGILITNVI